MASPFKLIIPQSNPIDPSGRVSREWQLFFLNLGNAVVASGTVTNTTGDLTLGQVIVGNGGADVKALPSGLDAYVVTMVGGIAAWAPASGLTAITDKTLLSNISGASAIPIGNTLSAILDNILGSTQGQLITRNASNWTVINPGTLGTVLTSGGPGANLSWAAGGGGAEINLVDAATVTVDCSLGSLFRLLCTSAVGATRAISYTNVSTAGQVVNLKVVQPHTGGPCGYTFNAAVKWGVGGLGSQPAVSTTADAVDVYSGEIDGSSIYVQQLGGKGDVGPTGPAGSPGPAFKVALTTGSAIGAATFTKCPFDTVLYDTASCWDAVNFRYKPNVAGKYRFVLHITIDPGPSDWGIADVRFNGAQVQISPIWAATVSGQVRMMTVIDFDMNGTTDYVEGYGYSNNSAGTFRALNAPAFYNSFSGSFLHT